MSAGVCASDVGQTAIEIIARAAYSLASMTTTAPETTLVETRRVSCDGASNIRGGASYRPAALGHPLVYLEIDESGFVDCGYCDRRFVLKGGPADT